AALWLAAETAPDIARQGGEVPQVATVVVMDEDPPRVGEQRVEEGLARSSRGADRCPEGTPEVDLLRSGGGFGENLDVVFGQAARRPADAEAEPERQSYQHREGQHREGTSPGHDRIPPRAEPRRDGTLGSLGTVTVPSR